MLGRSAGPEGPDDLCLGLGFEPLDWDLSLEARVWYLCWDLSFEAGIWASRLGFGFKALI